MFSIILLEPENSGNVGAVARVMKNFGFKELILVNPKCEINDECRKRAKHAQNILDNAKIVKKMPVLDTLIATTGIIGSDYNISRSPITPEQLTKLELKGKIGLVFGRESSGLCNEEIKKCDFVVSIPTSKNYPSLNLSHAVAIILYELVKNNKSVTSEIKLLTLQEKKQLNKIFNEILANLEFRTVKNKETQQKVWKKLLGKSFLSKREAYAVIGLLKKILEKIK